MHRTRCCLRICALLTAFAMLATHSASAQVSKKKRRKRPNRAAALAEARQEIYKKIDGAELKLFVYYPKNHKPNDKRAAIVFFFGGGWRSGSPGQFAQHCRYLASRGMVAITADYRVESRHNVKVPQCIADAKSAIRWVRTNAGRLGVDPQRIASAGGSAGGHLAAAVGTLNGFDEPSENRAVSSRPNLMLLFNPAVNLTARGFNTRPDSPKMRARLKRYGAEPEKISPTLHISKSTPPAIIFHGKADSTVPFTQAEEFAARMKELGIDCVVDGYAGEPHGFFNFGRGGNRAFLATLKRADEFLSARGFLTGPGNVKTFFASAKRR